MKTGHTIPKLPRDVREKLKGGPTSQEAIRLWVTTDTEPQAIRDMRAVGIRLARKAIRHQNQVLESVLNRSGSETPHPTRPAESA